MNKHKVVAITVKTTAFVPKNPAENLANELQKLVLTKIRKTPQEVHVSFSADQWKSFFLNPTPPFLQLPNHHTKAKSKLASILNAFDTDKLKQLFSDICDLIHAPHDLRDKNPYEMLIFLVKIGVNANRNLKIGPEGESRSDDPGRGLDKCREKTKEKQEPRLTPVSQLGFELESWLGDDNPQGISWETLTNPETQVAFSNYFIEVIRISLTDQDNFSSWKVQDGPFGQRFVKAPAEPPTDKVFTPISPAAEHNDDSPQYHLNFPGAFTESNLRILLSAIQTEDPTPQIRSVTGGRHLITFTVDPNDAPYQKLLRQHPAEVQKYVPKLDDAIKKYDKVKAHFGDQELPQDTEKLLTFCQEQQAIVRKELETLSPNYLAVRAELAHQRTPIPCELPLDDSEPILVPRWDSDHKGVLKIYRWPVNVLVPGETCAFKRFAWTQKNGVYNLCTEIVLKDPADLGRTLHGRTPHPGPYMVSAVDSRGVSIALKHQIRQEAFSKEINDLIASLNMLHADVTSEPDQVSNERARDLLDELKTVFDKMRQIHRRLGGKKQSILPEDQVKRFYSEQLRHASDCLSLLEFEMECDDLDDNVDPIICLDDLFESDDHTFVEAASEAVRKQLAEKEKNTQKEAPEGLVEPAAIQHLKKTIDDARDLVETAQVTGIRTTEFSDLEKKLHQLHLVQLQSAIADLQGDNQATAHPTLHSFKQSADKIDRIANQHLSPCETKILATNAAYQPHVKAYTQYKPNPLVALLKSVIFGKNSISELTQTCTDDVDGDPLNKLAERLQFETDEMRHIMTMLSGLTDTLSQQTENASSQELASTILENFRDLQNIQAGKTSDDKKTKAYNHLKLIEKSIKAYLARQSSMQVTHIGEQALALVEDDKLEKAESELATLSLLINDLRKENILRKGQLDTLIEIQKFIDDFLVFGFVQHYSQPEHKHETLKPEQILQLKHTLQLRGITKEKCLTSIFLKLKQLQFHDCCAAVNSAYGRLRRAIVDKADLIDGSKKLIPKTLILSTVTAFKKHYNNAIDNFFTQTDGQEALLEKVTEQTRKGSLSLSFVTGEGYIDDGTLYTAIQPKEFTYPEKVSQQYKNMFGLRERYKQCCTYLAALSSIKAAIKNFPKVPKHKKSPCKVQVTDAGLRVTLTFKQAEMNALRESVSRSSVGE